VGTRIFVTRKELWPLKCFSRFRSVYLDYKIPGEDKLDGVLEIRIV